MLNMALLNIMSGTAMGAGGMPDTSPFNIFGLMSPAVNLNACGHWPSCVLIWNRYLTTFQMYFRCEDMNCRPLQPRIGVGGRATTCEQDGERINFSTPYTTSSNSVNYWGIATNNFPNGASFRELMCGWIDFAPVERDYKQYINKKYNAFVGGYAHYWEHIPKLPTQLQLNAAANLAGMVGGTVWQAGCGVGLDSSPTHQNTFFQTAQRTPVVDGTQREGANWTCIVVPVRALTNHHKHEFANQMVIGFLQLEYPNQIGYGISYTFGIAKDPNCLPKKSNVKCGGQESGNTDWQPAPKLFEGFAPFNLDNFLQPFIRAGKLRGYGDAANIYNELVRLCWQTNNSDWGKSNYSDPNSGIFYKSIQSIWQGLIDGWLEQPYKDIFMEIGADPMYYINALQTHYPTECNFKSIMGCGESFDWGIRGNSAICSMVDALSVFKALSTYPEEFPVDLPALIANTH